MKSVRTLVACALVGIAFAGPAFADPADDLLNQADGTAYGVTVTAANTVTVARDRIGSGTTVPRPTVVRTLSYYTDGIFIVDGGSGPVVTLGGVVGDPSLWNCSTASGGGGPVTVTCTANPASGVTWQCGLMHVDAGVWSKPVDVYDWARDYARSVTAPIVGGRRQAALPNPRTVRWGRAAGVVSCDGQTLTTGQADQSNPWVTANTPMGAVSTLVCRAQYSPTSATAPVGPYEVICIDPPNRVG
jgi:hypothetical protein